MTRTQKGIGLMVLTTLSFSAQDAFSRPLAEDYNTLMVVMVRYWIFTAFLLAAAARRPEGPRAAVRSRHFPLHVARALLLVAEICLIVWSYTLIGLINAHAIFAVCPLLIVALSALTLGERISPLQWLAVGIGCAGVMVVLQPGGEVFTWPALLPLASAFLFATYSVLTRYTTRDERSFPALFWPPVVGMVVMTALGLPLWEPVAGWDWGLLLAYGLTSALSNVLLQRTYETVEASVVQPFAYLQIVFVTVIGVTLFNESLHPHVVAGVAIVVASGIFALWLQRKGGPA